MATKISGRSYKGLGLIQCFVRPHNSNAFILNEHSEKTCEWSCMVINYKVLNNYSKDDFCTIRKGFIIE